MPVAICDCCLDAEHGTELRGSHLLGPLLPALTPWLLTRRWFNHDDRCLDGLRPLAERVLVDGGGTVLLHCLLGSTGPGGPGGPDHVYQLVLGLRRSLPRSLLDAVVGRAQGGRWDGWWLYEATKDPELMGELLRGAVLDRWRSGLRFTATAADPVPLGLPARALSVEQSNTSVVYGNRLILKLFRRPERGVHPEVEVLGALTAAHCSATPALAGWLHTGGGGQDSFVLGIVEDFLPADGDGWELAVREAARAVDGAPEASRTGGGFTADAEALGAAVARVHAALAATLPAARLGPREVRAQAATMHQYLEEAVRTVPGLEPYTARIHRLFEDYAQVAGQGRGIAGQRVHGDLHLGQALRTPRGWRVIDFEGEPARSAAERLRPQSPLRDVAGMLRSFDYAAEEALSLVRPGPDADPGRAAVRAAERVRQSRRARAWAVRNRRAFSTGYAAAGGADPVCHPVLMRALEAEKAVYEAVYEAQYRQERLPVPLAAVRRLVRAL